MFHICSSFFIHFIYPHATKTCAPIFLTFEPFLLWISILRQTAYHVFNFCATTSFVVLHKTLHYISVHFFVIWLTFLKILLFFHKPLLYKQAFFCRLAHIFKNFHHFFIKNGNENKKRRTPSNIKLFVVRHGIFFKPISKLYQSNQGSSPLRILHLR